jgi:hypothetical protein
MFLQQRDPDRWNDPWFLGLPPAQKVFWLYLEDSAGPNRIWQEDLALAAEDTGVQMTREQYLTAFKDRIEVLADGVIRLIKPDARAGPAS